MSSCHRARLLLLVVPLLAGAVLAAPPARPVAPVAPSQPPGRAAPVADRPASAPAQAPVVTAVPADARTTGAAEDEQPLPASDGARIIDMEAIVVSGAQPGPGLWKVSRGDHVLWILGTLSPLPRRMQWIPDRMEEVIASSQQVLAPPTVTLDAGIGRFRSMLLLPSLFRARRNPDGATLADVVSPELYARWRVLKARYIGDHRGVEQWRPVFAAQELYEAAMRKSGLQQAGMVQPLVRKAAKRHRVPIVPSEVTIKVPNARATLRRFSEAALADDECFERTMSRIESDLDAMRARANAWAVGDIEALRAIPANDQYAACTQAFTGTALARDLGISDLRSRIAETWVANAEAALARNTSTFATLPISQLLPADGYLARLQAKGYVVEAP